VIGVLVVEDQPLAAEALVRCIDCLPGFTIVGQVQTGVEALHLLMSEHVDLVLLDIYLPDMSGLELLRRLRGGGNTVDVIVVTRARDLSVVHAAASYGVAHYLVKPFTFSAIRQRLERYQAFRSQPAGHALALAQQDVDRLLGRLRQSRQLPAHADGISPESLHAVVALLRAREGTGVSAAEVASSLGTSRVTARRYLEYLVDGCLVRRRVRSHHGAGRPELEYSWLPDQEDGSDRPDDGR
jgi:response regulator of citrate/malate metabolism